MIGKVQDVMAGSIVIGAADKAASAGTQAEVPEVKLEDKAYENLTSAAQAQNELNPNAAQQEQKEEPTKLDEKSVSMITKELNELMDKINCDITFKYHKDVGMMSVSMVNKKTDEVIKELPPEEMIDNIKKAREWIGAFLDKNA
ncbi:MAG: flagellar protein FlaG [Selenomonadaceae bacterium]|nr:flagellar protein FlaG [Selenomonadaceae bacterium]